MKGDKVLKVYGNNTFMYEIDKGWVVPELPPELEFPPDPIDPPPLLHKIEVNEIVSGGIIEGSNAIALTKEMGTYTTGWIEVKPNYTYTIIAADSNCCHAQMTDTLMYNNTLKYIKGMSPYKSVFNQTFITGANTRYVRIHAWTYPTYPEKTGGAYLKLSGQEIK